MNNWREQFDNTFFDTTLAECHNDEQLVRSFNKEKQEVKSFIETEIIEKLIEEIPEGCGYLTCDLENCNVDIKQQLRAKWLKQ